MSFTWLDKINLSQAHKEEIKKIFPNLKDSTLQKLYSEIERTVEVDNVFVQFDDKSIYKLSPSDIKKELKKLRAKLENALDIFKYLKTQDFTHKILDQHYYLANNNDLLMLNTSHEKIKVEESIKLKLQPKQMASGIEIILIRTIHAIQDYENEINPEGGRPEELSHVMLIINLANFFDKNLSLNPGIGEDQPFSRLINFILSNIIGSKSIDHKKQISSALKRRSLTNGD